MRGGYRDPHDSLLSEIYLTFRSGNADIGKVKVRDILNQEREPGASQVTDPALLDRITWFLSDNVGKEMSSQETRERELAPLRSIKSAHEKIVVVRQGSYETDVDGIKIVSARLLSQIQLGSYMAPQMGNMPQFL